MIAKIKNKSNKKKCKKYYFKEKKKRALPKMSEGFRLLDSSVQDTKTGTREGSTLVNATRQTMINLGEKLKILLKEDGLTYSTLSNYSFLDIGSGTCESIANFRSFHFSRCVGIEQSKNTFKASEMLFQKCLKKYPISIPFLPLLGNAYALTNFGGAFIIYSWLKGAEPNLYYLLFKIFVKEKSCMYFVTQFKYGSSLLTDNDITKRSVKLKGSMAGSGRHFTLFFYSKKKERVKRCKNYKQEDDGIGGDIMKAFQKFNTFNAKSKERKMEFIKELMIDDSCHPLSEIVIDDKTDCISELTN